MLIKNGIIVRKPKTLDEYVGQEHILGKDKILYIYCNSDEMIYITKAKNKKEALNKLWDRWIAQENEAIEEVNKKCAKEEGYVPDSKYYKKDFTICSIDELMKDEAWPLDDEIIMV